MELPRTARTEIDVAVFPDVLVSEALVPASHVLNKIEDERGEYILACAQGGQYVVSTMPVKKVNNGLSF